MESNLNTTENLDNPRQMKAVRQHTFGGPEVLEYEDAPIPELRPGEVRVRPYSGKDRADRLIHFFIYA